MNVAEQFVSTPAGRIWVGTYGADAPGLPLLVLHGGPGFLSMPREVCDLADERPVIFYDQLGCGRSERPADAGCFSVAHYVEELALLREALDLDRFHILAQSWGAMLAAEYVLRYQPRGLASLVLCGPLLSTPLWERDQRQYVKQLPETSIRIIEEAERLGQFDGADYHRVTMQYYQRHVCRLDPWPVDLLEALGQMNGEVYTTLWGHSEFTVTGTLKGADLLPRLPEIQQPVLLVCGEHDEAAPATIHAYRNQLPQGEMAVIPNASHCHHLEEPDIFRVIVRTFLRRTAAADSGPEIVPPHV
jgi:proline iminopeptidase